MLQKSFSKSDDTVRVERQFRSSQITDTRIKPAFDVVNHDRAHKDILAQNNYFSLYHEKAQQMHRVFQPDHQHRQDDILRKMQLFCKSQPKVLSEETCSSFWVYDAPQETKSYHVLANKLKGMSLKQHLNNHNSRTAPRIFPEDTSTQSIEAKMCTKEPKIEQGSIDGPIVQHVSGIVIVNSEDKPKGLTRNYIDLATKYQNFRAYNRYLFDASCVLCNSRTATIVFFPCEHKCVCENCYDAIHSDDSAEMHCHLCNTEIKVSFKSNRTGNKFDLDNKYWAWIYSEKNVLSTSFVKNFKDSSTTNIRRIKAISYSTVAEKQGKENSPSSNYKKCIDSLLCGSKMCVIS